LLPSNLTIRNNEITKVGQAGIQGVGMQNSTISGNNIHDYIIWGIDISGDYQVASGNTISGNVFHDMYQYDCDGPSPDTPGGVFWNGTSCTSPDNPHSDYIFLRLGSGTAPINNTIEKNLFYNNKTFSGVDGTAMIYLSATKENNVIRNNVFINPHSYYAVNVGGTNIDFSNNTIYTNQQGLFLGVFGSPLIGFNVKKNIFVASSNAIYLYNSAASTGITSDYNFFYSAQSLIYDNAAPRTSLSAWQTASNEDAHSNEVEAVADIKFISTVGYPALSSTVNLSLQPNSPAFNVVADIGASGVALPPLNELVVITPRNFIRF
jgi:hypothetical protein